MKLITNSSQASHLIELRQSFLQANEITVFVAYLSEYGLESICDVLTKAARRAKTIEFFCGLDGYITDPKALTSLFRILQRNSQPQHKLYLVETSSATFHPKVYVLKSPGARRVMIGSANLTGGGLEQNWEASIMLEGTEGEAIWDELKNFRKEILKVSREATETTISQYARRHRIFSDKRNAADRVSRREVDELPKLDLNKLEEYLQRYRIDADGEKTYKRRATNYRDAKGLLDKLVDGKAHSKADFIDRFGQLAGYSGHKGLWWSRGLQRSRNTVDSHYRTVIELIQAIRKNAKKRPAEVFATAQVYIDQVKGLGVNIATEIMNTYSPTTLAVLNRNPVAGLEFFGCNLFGETSTFTAERYASFTGIMNELRRACGFKSLAKADHFLNYIYWLAAKEQKKRKANPDMS